MVHMLKKKFISSWTLVKELKDMAANGTNLEVTKAAQAHLDIYKFPVMSVVSLPNGTVLSKMNANDLMESQLNEEILRPGFDDLLSYIYYQFLEKGVTEGRTFN